MGRARVSAAASTAACHASSARVRCLAPHASPSAACGPVATSVAAPVAAWVGLGLGLRLGLGLVGFVGLGLGSGSDLRRRLAHHPEQVVSWRLQPAEHRLG